MVLNLFLFASQKMRFHLTSLCAYQLAVKDLHILTFSIQCECRYINKVKKTMYITCQDLYYSESYIYSQVYGAEYDFLKILLLLEIKSWRFKISFLCKVPIDFPQEDCDSSHKQRCKKNLYFISWS